MALRVVPGSGKLTLDGLRGFLDGVQDPDHFPEEMVYWNAFRLALDVVESVQAVGRSEYGEADELLTDRIRKFKKVVEF